MEEKIIAIKLLSKFKIRLSERMTQPKLNLSLRNTGTIWPTDVWLCFESRM